MNRRVQELFSEAPALSERDRAELAWAEEVERRIRQIDAGEVELIPWEKVRADLFARLHGRS